MNDLAKMIAEETSEAYSFSRYGFAQWRASAQMLLDRGYDARETEAILRSKHMRYAADEAWNPESPTAKDLEGFMGRWQTQFTKAKVAELVEETFS